MDEQTKADLEYAKEILHHQIKLFRRDGEDFKIALKAHAPDLLVRFEQSIQCLVRAGIISDTAKDADDVESLIEAMIEYQERTEALTADLNQRTKALKAHLN